MLIDGIPASAESLLPFVLANDGHFTAMQVRVGRTRGLELHLQRLRDAHQALYGSELDVASVRALLRDAVRDHPDCYLRVNVVERDAGRPEIMTVARPPINPGRTPVALTSVKWTRAFPRIKHVGAFPQIQLARQASLAGFDDALLIDEHGHVAETTIANIAFITGHEVLWPTGPALEGISWKLLETALHEGGFASERGSLTVEQARRYQAGVLVNSVGVEPIARIDEHEFPASREAAAWLGAVYERIQPTEV